MKKYIKDLTSSLLVSLIVFALLYGFIAFAEWEINIAHWHWWSRAIEAISCGLVFLYVLGNSEDKK